MCCLLSSFSALLQCFVNTVRHSTELVLCWLWVSICCGYHNKLCWLCYTLARITTASPFVACITSSVFVQLPPFSLHLVAQAVAPPRARKLLGTSRRCPFFASSTLCVSICHSVSSLSHCLCASSACALYCCAQTLSLDDASLVRPLAELAASTLIAASCIHLAESFCGCTLCGLLASCHLL